MNEEQKQELQKLIPALEQDLKELQVLQDNTNAKIQAIQQKLESLKDIIWDKQSKKESSSMYKVLQDEKESTQVKSNVGDIKVDKEFMQKQIQKHLDNPNLRGMVTTQEMLSFPKVAKNMKAEYEERQQGHTWKVKANDESIINYGERDYGKGHRLLTAYSKTERGERGQPHREFKDRNFHNSVDESITQKDKTNIQNNNSTQKDKHQTRKHR